MRKGDKYYWTTVCLTLLLLIVAFTYGNVTTPERTKVNELVPHNQLCFKGLVMHRYGPNVFYELNADGKPIPCK